MVGCNYVSLYYEGTRLIGAELALLDEKVEKINVRFDF